MEIFKENTLAAFRSFFKDEIHLTGDWCVAVSEIIFPTKIDHIRNALLTSYGLSGFEDHQRNSPRANVISRPYNGERLGFRSGTFDTVSQLSATIKRTVDFPKL